MGDAGIFSNGGMRVGDGMAAFVVSFVVVIRTKSLSLISTYMRFSF